MNNELILKIDKIYVINLDKNIDRMEFISNAANKANINIKRLPAVYGKELLDNDERLDKYLVNGNKSKLSKCQIGCILSHIEIWKDAINNDYKTIIVFEDDANIPINFWESYNKVVSELPNNWDMLLFGGVYLGGVRYSKNLLKPYKKSGNYGTHAMLINVEFIKKVINNIIETKMELPIDNYLRNNYYYNVNYNIFFVSKTIVSVNYNFTSDIGINVPKKNYAIKIWNN